MFNFGKTYSVSLLMAMMVMTKANVMHQKINFIEQFLNS